MQFLIRQVSKHNEICFSCIFCRDALKNDSNLIQVRHESGFPGLVPGWSVNPPPDKLVDTFEIVLNLEDSTKEFSNTPDVFEINVFEDGEVFVHHMVSTI